MARRKVKGASVPEAEIRAGVEEKAGAEGEIAGGAKGEIAGQARNDGSQARNDGSQARNDGSQARNDEGRARDDGVIEVYELGPDDLVPDAPPEPEPAPEPEAPAAPEPKPHKEKNYVSAVVYIGEEKGCAGPFFKALTGALSARFEHYELVLVEDASRDGTEAEARAALEALEDAPPVTIIHMSLRQGQELAMNAGLDMAVGDFVWEFDSMRMPYPPEMILEAYDTCLEGNDIVSVSPEKNRNLTAALFYKLFNGASRTRYPLRTDVFRLLSRRAINRVRGLSATTPYRKAAYAASGLKMATLSFAGGAGRAEPHMRLSRAMDSLMLYTDVGSRASLGIAVAMLALMVLTIVYIVAVWLGGIVSPIQGWTTTMLLLSGGFFGVFLILALVLKFLGLLVDLIFRKQAYLVESVEKLMK